MWKMDITLLENVQSLRTNAENPLDGTEKRHILALAAVANYIKGPMVETQDAVLE